VVPVLRVRVAIRQDGLLFNLNFKEHKKASTGNMCAVFCD